MPTGAFAFANQAFSGTSLHCKQDQQGQTLQQQQQQRRFFSAYNNTADDESSAFNGPSSAASLMNPAAFSTPDIYVTSTTTSSLASPCQTLCEEEEYSCFAPVDSAMDSWDEEREDELEALVASWQPPCDDDLPAPPRGGRRAAAQLLQVPPRAVASPTALARDLPNTPASLAARFPPPPLRTAADAAAMASEEGSALPSKYVWDEDVLRLPRGKFVNYLKADILSEDQVADLRKARRRMKNRSYQKTARVRRVTAGKPARAHRRAPADLSRELRTLRAHHAAFARDVQALLGELRRNARDALPDVDRGLLSRIAAVCAADANMDGSQHKGPASPSLSTSSYDSLSPVP